MSARATPKRLGPAALTGSAGAKRTAVVLLDVLSGGCGVAEASRRLGISLMRYYALETRALQALLHGLEPRPKGRRRTAPDGVAAVREQQRLEREVLRLQALVRATQRAVAVAPPAKASPRRRKTPPRGRRVIAQLRASTTDPTASGT